MTYRKAKNRFEIWQGYCNRNRTVLDEINLPQIVLETESNFRQYLTCQTVDGYTGELPKLSDLEENLFWKLHMFVTEFFDMDTALFDAYENSRINR